MFEAIGRLATMTERLDAIRSVSSALAKADTGGASAELVTVLEEVSKTFTGFEAVLVRYLSLQFTDVTRDKDELEIVQLEGGQVRTLANEMRARCSKIGIIYHQTLRPWFASSSIPTEDRTSLDELFAELEASDSGVIIPAVDELADWLQNEVDATAALVDSGRYKEARERVRAARREAAPLRRTMGRINGEFRDLEIQFTV